MRPSAVRLPAPPLPQQARHPIQPRVVPPPPEPPKAVLRASAPLPAVQLRPSGRPSIPPPPIRFPGESRRGPTQAHSLQPLAAPHAARVPVPPPGRPSPPRLQPPALPGPGSVAPPQRVAAARRAVQPFTPAFPGGSGRLGKIDVVQPGGWADYIYDGMSFAGILASITTTIATAAGASGWGWLAPLALPFVGVFVQGALTIHTPSDVSNSLTGTDMRQKYLTLISQTVTPLLTTVVAVAIGAQAITASAATAGVVSFLMIILEALRVNWLDRETVYGVVWNKLKECCGGERQALLS